MPSGAADASPPGLTASPRARITRAVLERGERAVVDGCVALLAGRPVDDDLVLALGGRHAIAVLDGDDAAYWLRVWAVRGFLYAFDDVAVPSVIIATRDDAWRVRELASKVIARRHLDAAAGAVAALRADPVARVRTAAERAMLTLAAAPPDVSASG